MSAATIHEAIAELHAIAADAEREGSRFGYFAALYARVTEEVEARIRRGFFEDGPWMERLDVLFANRYLDALRRWREADGGVTASWEVAFKACEDPAPTVLQHLYLGMNAHLLVDLPLSLIEACEGRGLPARRGDFARINDVVGALMDGFHEDLGRASPVFGAVLRRAAAAWDAGSWVTLVTAREIAWWNARQLARYRPDAWPALAARFDARAAWMGRQILEPGPVGRRAFGAVRAGEGEDVRAIVRALAR